jgi:D-alanyl-D-alanine carboxypeptidase/D-alanyl-D-alanine-endopeptidase (penicillin-binding protein 4)
MFAFRSLLASFMALAFAAAHAATPTPLPPPVAKALARAKISANAISIVVEEAGAGKPKALVSHRADAPMNPASVLKLVTTFAALETLGPNWRWKTPVYVDDPIKDGVLQGNLYIQGRGDPNFVAERLWLLMRRIQGLGIRSIVGDIVLDDSLFKVEPQDPAEFDGEPLRPYNAAPDALLLNFKSVLMTFTPDAAAGVARLHVEPPLAGVQWPATVPLSNAKCGDWRGALKADFSDVAKPVFRGRYPADCDEKIWPLADAEPQTYSARAIAGMWAAVGGTLQGQVKAGTVPQALQPAFALESPPLAQIVRDINKFSNNVMTQQLFLTLSLEQDPAPAQATLAASQALVRQWWLSHFGANDAPRITNGSGLSRDDRISAAALARLLQYAWASPLMPELLTSLPISGQDGTLKPEHWKAQGHAHLKTGSLRDVASIAGVVDGASGKRYVVVAIVNAPNPRNARPVMESLVDWVAAR